jgi:ABC-2 type transport system ATP-binding protein
LDEAVSVLNLRKHYGEVAAVDGVSFQIKRGEIFGLLGPNGAGKTTTVELIEGLRKPDGGEIRVLGVNPQHGLGTIQEIIGVQLQQTTLYERIRVNEVIDLFGSYYPHHLPTSEILETVSLQEKEGTFVQDLSGGQRQRLALGLALVNDPQILLLDEPTTGLDPQARRNLWEVIETTRGKGKTVLLTTHYMEEAERLCDRVGIIDHGRLIALGSPRELIEGQELNAAVELSFPDGIEKSFLESLPGVNLVTQDGDRFLLYTTSPHKVLLKLVRLYDQGKLRFENISVRRATLEDLFLELTGRRLRD